MNIAINIELTKAHAMLALKKDWDDEGALPIAPATFAYMTALLIDTPANTPAPSISPFNDGSIDLHWRARELLVNVGEKVTYYGKDNTNQVKGEIVTLEDWHTLMGWLVQGT
jgi:hypothetical protein